MINNLQGELYPFEKLYTNENVSKSSINELLKKTSNNKEISNENFNLCEVDIYLHEIIQSKKPPKNNKSPGNDGLAAEFFKDFSAPILLGVYGCWKEFAVMGILSRTGIVSANYKKCDKNDIEYYRPISLLNQEYKIYTTILENTMLSMFNIVTEVLTNFIIVDARIKGMQIGNQEIKIVSFADDTTIFLGDINCLNRIRTILKLYEKASSSKISFSKSQALWVDEYKNRVDQPGNMEWPLFSIKILGINLVNSTLNNSIWEKMSENIAKNPNLEQCHTLFER